jgi:hypothetical protein
LERPRERSGRFLASRLLDGTTDPTAPPPNSTTGAYGTSTRTGSSATDAEREAYETRKKAAMTKLDPSVT